MTAADEDNAMRKDTERLLFDVLGNDVIASLHGGINLARPVECQRTSGGDAVGNHFVGARTVDDAQDIVCDVVADANLAEACPKGNDLLTADNRRKLLQQLL